MRPHRRSLFRAAFNVARSPAQLWGFASDPWKVAAILFGRRPLGLTEAVCSLLPGVTPESVEARRSELARNAGFLQDLDRRCMVKRNRPVIHNVWREFLYVVIRLTRPEVIIETGVFDGVSSSFILRALHDNVRGQLVSVDLPAFDVIQGSTHAMAEGTLPPNCEPGWIVSPSLRERHRLLLGDSKRLLPELFVEYPRVDMFFHDSLHTFEHQYFEYATAWPHLAEGGLLVSDDIDWSGAYYKFSRKVNRPYVTLDNFGALMK